MSILSALGITTPEHFESLSELKGWLNKQNIGDDNCLKAALSLQEKANCDGYYMNTQISDMKFYYRYFPSPPEVSKWTKDILNLNRVHAYNSTIVDGYIYYIEPQKLEISKASFRVY